MNNNARGSNISPGVYSREIDISYSAQTLGETTLGLVGETIKGPAFEPVMVENWTEFKDYFGGFSAEKFKDSNYPKYELPYIAESYLRESNQLQVCRVLGLSGYNAGPAWVISATKDDTQGSVVAIIRSRGDYQKISKTGDNDDCGNVVYKYDFLNFDIDELKIAPYTNLSMSLNCGEPTVESLIQSFDINSLNYGQFTLVCFKNGDEVGRFPISLIPDSKDYILNVLGNKQDSGSTPIYVEELYDLSLKELILSGDVTKIYNNYVAPTFNPDGSVLTPEVLGIVTKFNDTPIIPIGEPVLDIVSIEPSTLTRNNVGQRYLADKASVDNGFTFNKWSYNNNNIINGEYIMELGHIYTVRSYRTSNGTIEYVYTEYDDVKYQEMVTTGSSGIGGGSTGQVFVLSYDRYFMLDGNGDVNPVACDLNNYKEQYRCASTPWFVSELKGDGKNIEVKKLFRFHTISDGDAANVQVKVSITNVKPDEGLFDVLIRDYNDSDNNVNTLESYRQCSMLPGNSNYIGLQIGTTDGEYISNSKYVTVEVIENDTTAGSIPCGFLGYPLRNWDGLQVNGDTQSGLTQPNLTYNVLYDEDIKDARQYFGMSSIVGVDVDVLNYKGVDAYSSNYESGYTRGFHLDSTLNDANTDVIVSVDGEYGFKWTTVSPNSVTDEGIVPIIGNEVDMVGTIYENINLRKFTAYPYGGFDGFDVYRDSRTNTDEFKATKYKGDISNNQGTNFSTNINGDGLGLTGKFINSDYYAYLAGCKQFDNPSSVDINIFATPGIDYVNNKLLVEEVIDIVENDRADSLYIVTTPDKPFGASDAVSEMYNASDAASNAVSSDIDSSWVATYYPWVKYFDKTNNKYINLPVTKDIVRNLAFTDKTSQPWYAPAGLNRGVVDCEKAHYNTRLSDENTLYEKGVNPIKTIATDGVYVNGQKTMYSKDTPLNRINVRRLMIRVRKLVTLASMSLLFDPNDAPLSDQFLSLVDPILSNVKSNRGISDYRIELDTSDEARDRLELPAKIFIKPINALEYIDLSFIITPQSVNFDDINI